MHHPPDLIIVNARIHTVDPVRPVAEAMAIRGEVITRVGANADVRQLAGPLTRVIDADGRRVIPGFNDAHVHFVRGAEEIVGVDLRPSTDASDMAARIKRYVATIPRGQWVTGGYWDHEAWPGRSLPTRAEIDVVSPDHPVFV